jgi:sporulation protein YlmC with PRC-barrel domain
MEIIFGAEVVDRNGKSLGTVSNVVRDSWTGDISKFSVSSKSDDIPLFYSPQDVAEATDKKIKLKVAFGEVNVSIQYGAKVIDVNGRIIGMVDYTVNNPLTGEVTKFRVNPDTGGDDLFFSKEDVDIANPAEVKLKIAFKH